MSVVWLVDSNATQAYYFLKQDYEILRVSFDLQGSLRVCEKLICYVPGGKSFVVCIEAGPGGYWVCYMSILVHLKPDHRLIVSLTWVIHIAIFVLPDKTYTSLPQSILHRVGKCWFWYALGLLFLGNRL